MYRSGLIFDQKENKKTGHRRFVLLKTAQLQISTPSSTSYGIVVSSTVTAGSLDGIGSSRSLTGLYIVILLVRMCFFNGQASTSEFPNKLVSVSDLESPRVLSVLIDQSSSQDALSEVVGLRDGVGGGVLHLSSIGVPRNFERTLPGLPVDIHCCEESVLPK